MTRPRRRTFVIVGGGLAGATAAATLRKEGFDGRLILFGDDPERPYELPPLSKGYLRGEDERDKVFVHGDAFYSERDIELRVHTRVSGLQPATQEVVTDGGERLRYDRLLLATGASPRHLRVPGADLPGVHYLRTLADADQVRAALARAEKVVVVGGGWIGAEVAASVRQLGLEVSLVAPGAVPVERVLGQEVGKVYYDLHAERGVELLMQSRVEGLVGSGRVEAVRVGDGRLVAADLVVIGIGTEPSTDIARTAGVAVDGGVVADEYLRTNVPGVFAAGDVASVWHPRLGSRLRVEHWDNAKRQARAAARNMLDRDAPYDRIPYFYSDQYDLGMEYSGYAPEWDRVVFRGDPAAREFIAFWLKGGRVVAGMNANVWDVNPSIEALVRAEAAVDVNRLVDLGTPLEDLAPLT